jgi:energy-coupling factor transport system ATP-binding protein
MMTGLITVRGLAYRYGETGGDTIQALNGIDLDVERGDYLAIVGLNGSGKSTLARCLSGLLAPGAGDVLVDGSSTRDHGALIAIRSTIGMVFQNPENQFVTSTVEDEVAFGPENLGVPAGEIRMRVDRALGQVALGDRLDRDPRTLSAGEKTRLAIASVLAMQPECLVLDEATAMLDPASRRSVLALVDQLHQDGMTVIVVTHHMSEVARAHRVILLDAGRLVLEGAPADVFGQEAGLAQIGLALPPAATIAHGLATRGLRLAGIVVTPEELVAQVQALYGANS